MRAYFFGNMYLSSIQQGIQALHVTHDLFLASMSHDAKHILKTWASDHKTVILLNGGYSSELRDLQKFFNDSRNPYPWAVFHEAQDALDGALTCVGIILPERVYDLAADLRSGDPEAHLRAEAMDVDTSIEYIRFKTALISRWDCEVAKRLNKYGLAK